MRASTKVPDTFSPPRGCSPKDLANLLQWRAAGAPFSSMPMAHAHHTSPAPNFPCILPIVHLRAIMSSMTGADFIRRIRKIANRRGVAVHFDARHGKGSHGRLYYGDRFTTVKNRKKEIGPGLLRKMLADLGLSIADIEE